MQATVQAALALSPRDAVNAAYQPKSAEGIRYGGYATDALTIAVFEILIAGTLGTLLIRFFAPKLLDKVQRLLHSLIILLCMLLFFSKCLIYAPRTTVTYVEISCCRWHAFSGVSVTTISGIH